MLAFEPRRIARTVLFGLISTWTVLAGPTLTTIQDTLYRADGTPYDGLVMIQWKSFDAADLTVVGHQGTTVRVVNGFLMVKLVPTVNASTPTTYQVTYNSDGKYQYQEFWSVPVSSTPLRIRDVRISSDNAVTPPAEQVLVLISEVVGLQDALDTRAVKGPGYASSRAAMISASGQLEGVVGDPSECVKVDGTAGPCGTGGTFSGPIAYVDSEVPGGAVNGANTTFTLANVPSPAGSLSVYRNGLLLDPQRDLSLVGSTLTFASASTPQTGDSLVAYYRITAAGAISPNFVDGAVPAGTVNGTNATFTLTNAPNPAASLRLYRNGLMMKNGLDYSASDTTIQFLTGAVPQTGDILLVYYRY